MEPLTILYFLALFIGILFFVCYAYQLYYMPVAFFKKKPEAPHAAPLRYAVLICARNEEAVIGQLLDSIRRQEYPSDHLVAFVAADNCTDDTAETARKAGAVVYERFNKKEIGKGYALDFLLNNIRDDYGDDYFDGFFVFDADNLLMPDYISRMNDTLQQGYSVVTSFRNSKNYGDNWISAGYALWFIRDSAFLNAPRCKLGLSCMVAGTGFLFSREAMLRLDGWPFHGLTEDVEFTAHSILKGEKIGYCGKAEIFDEQPTQFGQSWKQRLRWSKGYLQVMKRYGGKLLRGIGKKNGGSCFDFFMSIFPAMVLSIVGCAAVAAAMVLALFSPDGFAMLAKVALFSFAVPYTLLYVIGVVTTISQRKRIRATPMKKFIYTFTFPFFMLTYVPLAIAAFFTKVSWEHIDHTVSVSIDEMNQKTRK